MTDTSRGGRTQPAFPEERRRYVRIRKEISLTYSVVAQGHAHGGSSSLDLSIGGVQFPTSEALEPDTELLLTLSIAATGVSFNIRGKVAWCHYNEELAQHEVGVGFLGMEPLQRENILALIASDLPAGEESERRRFVRLRSALHACFRLAGDSTHDWQTASIRDLSLGGFAMIADIQLKSNAAVALRIHLRGPHEDALEMEAVLLSSAPIAEEEGHFRTSGKFQNLTPATFERLAAYVSEHVAGPTIGPFKKSRAGE